MRRHCVEIKFGKPCLKQTDENKLEVIEGGILRNIMERKTEEDNVNFWKMQMVRGLGYIQTRESDCNKCYLLEKKKLNKKL